MTRSPRLTAAAAFALVTTVVLFVMSALAAAAHVRQWRLLELLDDGAVSPLALPAVQAAEQIVITSTLVWVAVLVVQVVAMAVFLRTAYRTAEWLGLGPLRYGPRWAAFGWFVPVMSLWVPGRIAGDLWRASSPQRAWPGPARLVVTWWTLFLVSIAGNRVLLSSPALDDPSADLAEYLAANQSYAVQAALLFALDAVVAVLTGLVVAVLVLRLAAAARHERPGLPAPGTVRQTPIDRRVPLVGSAAVAGVAALLALVGLLSGTRMAAQVPESVTLAAGEAPAATAPAPTPTSAAPAAPLHATVRAPAGFTPVTDDDIVTGPLTIDQVAELAGANGVDVAAMRRQLDLLGFTAGHSAAWRNGLGTLYVDVYEWRTAEAASYWVTSDEENGTPFDVGLPGVVGSILEGDPINTITSFPVGNRSYSLFWVRDDGKADVASVKEYTALQMQAAQAG